MEDMSLGKNVEIRLLRMIRESVKNLPPTNIRRKSLMGRKGFPILEIGLLNKLESFTEKHPFIQMIYSWMRMKS